MASKSWELVGDSPVPCPVKNTLIHYDQHQEVHGGMERHSDSEVYGVAAQSSFPSALAATESMDCPQAEHGTEGPRSRARSPTSVKLVRPEGAASEKGLDSKIVGTPAEAAGIGEGLGMRRRNQRPGRRERQELKFAAEGNQADDLGHPVAAVQRRQMVAPMLTVLMLIALTIVGLICAFSATKDVDAAAKIMLKHSEDSIARSQNRSSIVAMQDKLEFSKMQIDVDTQVFTAQRHMAPQIFQDTCDLPPNLCKKVVAMLHATHGQLHKKTSEPLNDNAGSYVGLWVWVRPTGIDGEVQVAYKAATLSYRLRDVVEYADRVETEPVIRCETMTQNSLFSSTTTEHCREVSTSTSVTKIPVFKPAVLNPQEIAFVDSMMEQMVAEKCLENHKLRDSRTLHDLPESVSPQSNAMSIFESQ